MINTENISYIFKYKKWRNDSMTKHDMFHI